FGLTKNENSIQGSFIVEELTDLVEEAVLQEFEKMNDRGGVLGAMERQYQRGKIQEESLYYEGKKHSGELPIVGVNTYLSPNPPSEDQIDSMELARASTEEKEHQINELRQFQDANKAQTDAALKQLKQVAASGGNIFVELMETVKVASLGQITNALYEVGGQHRRNMKEEKVSELVSGVWVALTRPTERLLLLTKIYKVWHNGNTRFPRATLQLPRKQKPLPAGSSAGTGTAHCSSHRKPLCLLVPQKNLLLFRRTRKDPEAFTSHEENWFVFSRSRLPSAPIYQHRCAKL